MNLTDLLQALQDTSFATAIREGGILFPWIECVHVIALVTVVGTISIVDMRLLGLPSHRKGLRQLSKDVLPITWVAFAFAAASGFLLFSSRAVKYVSLWQFDAKMVLLVLAALNMLYFHFVTFRDVHVWDDFTTPPRSARIAGFVSLILWLGVVTCGRMIGFEL